MPITVVTGVFHDSGSAPPTVCEMPRRGKVSRKKIMEKCGKTAVSKQRDSHLGVSGYA